MEINIPSFIFFSRGAGSTTNQWEIQDPKIEVLYHIRPYFAGISPYIGLKNRLYNYMVGTSNESVPGMATEPTRPGTKLGSNHRRKENAGRGKSMVRPGSSNRWYLEFLWSVCLPVTI